VRMHRDLYGNGTPGILSRLERFITHHEAQESEREKQHTQNRDRLNIIIALLAAIAAYIAIVVSIHGLPKQAALPLSDNTSLTSNATEARCRVSAKPNPPVQPDPSNPSPYPPKPQPVESWTA
jgi:hypothetical protein